MHCLSYALLIQFHLSDGTTPVPISLMQDMDSYDI